MDFIKDNALRRFYMSELEGLLAKYEPGRPEMKPDVIAQTLQLEKERAKMAEDAAAGSGGNVILQNPGQPPVTLNNKQIVEIIQALQNDVASRDQEIARLNKEYQTLELKYKVLQHEKLTTATTTLKMPTAEVSQNTANNSSHSMEPETIYV
jgi:hypothetical protein